MKSIKLGRLVVHNFFKKFGNYSLMENSTRAANEMRREDVRQSWNDALLADRLLFAFHTRSTYQEFQHIVAHPPERMRSPEADIAIAIKTVADPIILRIKISNSKFPLSLSLTVSTTHMCVCGLLFC